MKDTIEGVFTYYNEVIKPIYAGITAEGNTLPVELQFEIHAAFDHLSRYFVSGQSEEEVSKKARSHLKRSALDAFKLRLKHYHLAYSNLQKYDLQLIDCGKFLNKIVVNHAQIIKSAKMARQTESLLDDDKAFQSWYDVDTLIDEFYLLTEDVGKLEWAQSISKRYSIKSIIISNGVTFIASVLATLFVTLLLGVLNFG